MKLMLKILAPFFLLALAEGRLPGQTQALQLHAKYSEGQGVKVKFIPRQWADFRDGLQKGFLVERMELDASGNGSFRQVSAGPVRPYSKEQWAQVKDGERHFEAQQQLLEKVLDPPAAPASGLQIILDGQSAGNLMGLYLLRFTQTEEAAEGSGLQFTDSKAEAGKSYLYRASIAGTKTEGTVHLFTEKNSWLSPNIEALAGDRTATLFWEHDSEASPFLAYFIEKSADGKRFSPASSDLLFYNKALEAQDSFFQENQMQFTDSLAENGVTWHYRIVAKDLFGELAAPSNVAQVTGIDRTPPTPPFNLQYTAGDEEKTLTLTWEKTETEPDLTGFYVMGANSETEEFQALHEAPLPPDSRSFLVEKMKEGQRLHYAVMAFDRNGNSASSQPKVAVLRDAAPPAPPTGLAAKIDGAGRLRIEWQANTEPDLAGYRVLSSLLPQSGFANLSTVPLKEPLFLDTLPLDRLLEDFYFRVVAFDKVENYSEPSATVKVSIPDTIPPVAPLLKTAIVEDGAVEITWAASTSLDVMEHQLQRRSLPEGDWSPVFSTNSAKVQEFTDPKVEPGKHYEYRLLAKDDAGLITPSQKTREVAVPAKSTAAPVTGLKAEKTVDDTIALTWLLPKGFEGRALLYRAVDGGKPALYQSLKTLAFQDSHVSTGKAYSYFIIAQYPGGRLSERSDSVEVKK